MTQLESAAIEAMAAAIVKEFGSEAVAFAIRQALFSASNAPEIAARWQQIGAAAHLILQAPENSDADQQRAGIIKDIDAHRAG